MVPGVYTLSGTAPTAYIVDDVQTATTGGTPAWVEQMMRDIVRATIVEPIAEIVVRVLRRLHLPIWQKAFHPYRPRVTAARVVPVPVRRSLFGFSRAQRAARHRRRFIQKLRST